MYSFIYWFVFFVDLLISLFVLLCAAAATCCMLHGAVSIYLVVSDQAAPMLGIQF